MTNFPSGFDDIKDEPTFPHSDMADQKLLSGVGEDDMSTTEEQQARIEHDQELKDEGYIESQALDNK